MWYGDIDVIKRTCSRMQVLVQLPHCTVVLTPLITLECVMPLECLLQVYFTYESSFNTCLPCCKTPLQLIWHGSLANSSIMKLERRQPERIPAVLDAKDAEQEAVHAQNDTSPDHDGDFLITWVGHARDFERQADSCEGKDAVYGHSSALQLGRSMQRLHTYTSQQRFASRGRIDSGTHPRSS